MTTTPAPRVVALACDHCGTTEALVDNGGRIIACLLTDDGASACDCLPGSRTRPRRGLACEHLTAAYLEATR